MTGIVVVYIRVFVRIRHGEDWMIQKVEGFEPELELEPLRNRCDFLGGKVETHEVRPAENPSPSIAIYL